MPVPDRVPPDTMSSLQVADGVHLFTQAWTQPDPKAIVLLVHGYGEHSGRYGHVARALNDISVSVYAYDQRGYGRSEGRTAYVDTFDQYLDDLRVVHDHVRHTAPNIPLYLFGHSMGGAVVLLYVLERQTSGIDGLILSSPAIEVDPDIAPLLRKLAKGIGRVLPTLPVVASPEGAISRDPDVVAEAEADPLNYHGRVLARTGAEIISACQRIQGRLDVLSLPFLVFHGTADALTSPDASRHLYDVAPSDEKTIHLYDGLYHETFNEPERETVLQDVTAWLSRRIEA
jgi:alpha-beta hydrolase superfamily lysophospholipase